MLVIAGGFSYADALGAGRMFALQLEHRVGDMLRAVRRRGEAGDRHLQRLPGVDPNRPVARRPRPQRQRPLPVRVGHAADGAEPLHLDLRASTTIDCPIAHGEGRYTHPDPSALAAAGQIALRYSNGNPNGSVDDIAGVCDPSGVVLGLMPHPENHVIARQFPGFTHRVPGALGLTLFEQGVRYAKER